MEKNFKFSVKVIVIPYVHLPTNTHYMLKYNKNFITAIKEKIPTEKLGGSLHPYEIQTQSQAISVMHSMLLFLPQTVTMVESSHRYYSGHCPMCFLLKQEQ
jgi:hypothetical protein